MSFLKHYWGLLGFSYYDIFVRRENQAADPKESFPQSDFTFNKQVDLLSQGIDLPNDETIRNVVQAESLTLRTGEVRGRNPSISFKLSLIFALRRKTLFWT